MAAQQRELDEKQAALPRVFGERLLAEGDALEPPSFLQT